MHTAKNTPWLAEARQDWNAKIYKKVLMLYNDQGEAAAANYLQQFSISKIPGATVAPPRVEMDRQEAVRQLIRMKGNAEDAMDAAALVFAIDALSKAELAKRQAEYDAIDNPDQPIKIELTPAELALVSDSIENRIDYWRDDDPADKENPTEPLTALLNKLGAV